ncbi:phage tail protein [Psychromonas ossibalaenae]|uniref:phage tail protein n=1 Tax=Psychromonas ossibalaenae TaxID=444922 RepID=UPI00037FAFC4|nr:phage tail protein [Psychromonas ossibalaenae]
MSAPLSQTDAGYYLQGLLSHLKKVTPERQHKHIECWMEDVEILVGAKNQGLGRDIGYISYSALFTFERFPFQQVDPAVIIANVMAWIMDNDQHRDEFELNDPVFDVESESETTVLMNLEIEFIEPVMVVPDDAGPIYWQDSHWSLAPYEIWTAVHGDVVIANTQPAS